MQHALQEKTKAPFSRAFFFGPAHWLRASSNGRGNVWCMPVAGEAMTMCYEAEGMKRNSEK
jgi:hypothetical protein